MDTMQAFAMAQINSNKEMKVFDWEKAARIIKERKATTASAGLSGDWEWTGGAILTNGVPVPKEDTYPYLASVWATPELEVDGELMDCFRMESATPGWNAETYWPKEAMEIISA